MKLIICILTLHSMLSWFYLNYIFSSPFYMLSLILIVFISFDIIPKNWYTYMTNLPFLMFLLRINLCINICPYIICFYNNLFCEFILILQCFLLHFITYQFLFLYYTILFSNLIYLVCFLRISFSHIFFNILIFLPYFLDI